MVMIAQLYECTINPQGILDVTKGQNYFFPKN